EFPHAGKWYDYFTGDSINILPNQTAGNNFTIQYDPGEYHIYIDSLLPVPDLYVDTTGAGISEAEIQDPFKTSVYPNPFSDEQTICYTLPASGTVVITVFDLVGAEVNILSNDTQQAGIHYLKWNGTNRTGEKIKSGYYFLTIRSGNFSSTQKIVYIEN
ncbi:MAG TPA: T9SS type A sorting domain-containing protein, partial [Bacteroidales bacterium]|nr:T9SS type A sorting domain-containing protein [Bacteroidales bacterium]